jgi:hypothetical protein
MIRKGECPDIVGQSFPGKTGPCHESLISFQLLVTVGGRILFGNTLPQTLRVAGRISGFRSNLEPLQHVTFSNASYERWMSPKTNQTGKASS